MNDQTTPSVRDRQRAAAAVLVKLLESDLPPAAWTIYAHGPAAELEGQLKPGLGAREALAVWAAHLGPGFMVKHDVDGVVRGRLRATVDGVRIFLWAQIRDPSGVKL